MNIRRTLTGVLSLALLSSIFLVLNMIRGQEKSTPAEPARSGHTASLQHLKLDQLVDRSGKIFRGTILDFQPGTIEAGGGSLPTVTYRVRVEEAFKGDFPAKEGSDALVTEVTMLGNLKSRSDQGAVRKLATLPELPKLQVGGDYLLILTAPSEIGLTAPVGLGQGAFTIFEQDKQEWAKNEFDNAGLFDGPVRYEELAAKIRRGGRN